MPTLAPRQVAMPKTSELCICNFVYFLYCFVNWVVSTSFDTATFIETDPVVQLRVFPCIASKAASFLAWELLLCLVFMIVSRLA